MNFSNIHKNKNNKQTKNPLKINKKKMKEVRPIKSNEKMCMDLFVLNVYVYIFNNIHQDAD